MNKFILLTAALLLGIPIAHAQHKHVHGEGKLDAVLDKETLTLELELPLDAAIGFERAPRNEKEKAAFTKALKILNDPALWTPTPAAQCQLQSSQAEFPFEEGLQAHEKHEHHEHEEHADIEARYVFHCTHPAALKSIETTLFKSMPRLYRLEAQRSGPSGQGAQRITPKNPVLNW